MLFGIDSEHEISVNTNTVAALAACYQGALSSRMTASDQMPDFLVIGAARAGTTALYEGLRGHPDIFLTPVKETNYFSYAGTKPDVKGPGADFINNSMTDLSDYRTQFAEARPGQMLGEISPLYLFEPDAPKNICDAVPDVRLIAILRNPIDQAWSHFLYARHHAIEAEADFVRALDLEEERLAQGWQPLFGYSRFPRYGEQLARYFAQFPQEQILILDYDDFRTDAVAFQAQICRFIGVNDTYQAEVGKQVNAGGSPRSRFLQELIMRPNALTAPARVLPLSWRRAIRDRLAGRNVGTRQEMPEAARAILGKRLADDVAALSDLLGRDYSHWLAEGGS
jgi:hypothetical protein